MRNRLTQNNVTLPDELKHKYEANESKCADHRRYYNYSRVICINTKVKFDHHYNKHYYYYQ